MDTERDGLRPASKEDSNPREVRESTPADVTGGAPLPWRGSTPGGTRRAPADEYVIRERDFSTAILDAAGALIVVLDREGRIVRFNRSCERITGYAAEEVEGQCFWDLFLLPEELAPVKAVFDRLSSGSYPNQHENYWVTRDGRRRRIAWSNTVLTGEGGRVEYVVGIGIDVTEQRQAEEEREQLLAEAHEAGASIQKLAASLEREWRILQTIMENTHACLAYLDPRFNFVRVNQAYAQESGHSREELLGSNHFDLFPNAENEAIFEQVRESGRPIAFRAKPFEYADQPERGVTYWDWSLVPVKNAAGQVEGLVFSLLDVTDQVRAAQEREELLEANRAQREFLQRLIESAPVGIAVVSGPDHCYELVNTYYQGIPGTAAEPMVGRSIAEVFPSVAAAGALALVEEVYRTGRIVSIREYEAAVGRGRERTYWDVDHVPLTSTEGKVERVLILAHEITAEVEAREMLREQNEELQALTQELDAYAHSVAHDLEQPLSVIVGLADLLYEDLAGSAEAPVLNLVRNILNATIKMEEIVRSLLLLASTRKHEVKTEPLDMPAIVDEALRRLGSTIEDSEAVVIAPEAWPQALGYRPWIEGVWVNYVSNALKYGGRPPRVELGASGPQGGMVRFWVRDNGAGLTETERSRLFTAFTQLDRDEPRGHGLGLTIVRRSVEKLGGQVGVESQVGEGSTFWFALPQAGHPSQPGSRP